MEEWDISCAICGKYILTEQWGMDNEIRCIHGSYESGYYDGEQDAFYCKQCEREKRIVDARTGL